MKSQRDRVTYLIQPRLQFAHLNQNRILSVDIQILDEDSMDVYMQANLDWQRGLDVWQSECIDPPIWSAIAEQMLLAMKEASKLIDSESYCCGEPG